MFEIWDPKLFRKMVPSFNFSGECAHTSAKNIHVIYYINLNRFVEGLFWKVNKCFRFLVNK